jgi:hypothetical protein
MHAGLMRKLPPPVRGHNSLSVSGTLLSFGGSGCAVLLRAQVRYFKHNDAGDLERVLLEVAAEDRRLRCAGPPRSLLQPPGTALGPQGPARAVCWVGWCFKASVARVVCSRMQMRRCCMAGSVFALQGEVQLSALQIASASLDTPTSTPLRCATIFS